MDDGDLGAEENCSIIEEAVDYANFGFIFTGVLQSGIAVLGIAGNAIILAIFSRRQTQTGIQPYLHCLAGWDLLLTVSGWLLFALPPLIYGEHIPLHGNIVRLYYALYPLCNVALVGCTWINLTCAIERCLAISYPLRHRSLGRARRIRISMILISVCAVLFNIPRYLEYEVGVCYDHDARRTYPSLRMGPLGESTVYIRGYLLTGQFLFVTGGPFLVLLALSVRIYRTVQNSNKAGHYNYLLQLARNSSQQAQTTITRKRRKQEINRMLIILLAKFLTCFTLPTVLDCMHVTLESGLRTHPLFEYLADVSNAFVMLHSATNVFIYLACQQQFRFDCKRLLTGRKLQSLPTPDPSNAVSYRDESSVNLLQLDRVLYTVASRRSPDHIEHSNYLQVPRHRHQRRVTLSLNNCYAVSADDQTSSATAGTPYTETTDGVSTLPHIT